MYSMGFMRFCKFTLHCLLHVNVPYLHPEVKLRSYLLFLSELIKVIVIQFLKYTANKQLLNSACGNHQPSTQPSYCNSCSYYTL